MKANLGSLALVLLGIPLVLWMGRDLPWTFAHLAGLILLPAGAIFLIVARIQLGTAFSVRAKGTHLVTTGLYARIRNPIYVFGGVALAGGILWFNRPFYLLVFVALIPMQVLRARKEGEVLQERFGAAYEEYRRGTWF